MIYDKIDLLPVKEAGECLKTYSRVLHVPQKAVFRRSLKS